MGRTASHRTPPPPGDPARSTFCYWLKRWRAYLGVTQRRFAELWGVSPSLVQKIEADDYSVSQLSFERLEALRTLLQLPSTTFYPLIATHADARPDQDDGEVVKVQRLEPQQPPLSVPRALLGETSPAHLSAYAVAAEDLATDRWRLSLRTGSLVICDTLITPRTGELALFQMHFRGRDRRILAPHASGAPLFLQAFDPGRDEILEPSPADLELLGVVIAQWVVSNER